MECDKRCRFYQYWLKNYKCEELDYYEQLKREGKRATIGQLMWYDKNKDRVMRYREEYRKRKKKEKLAKEKEKKKNDRRRNTTQKRVGKVKRR